MRVKTNPTHPADIGNDDRLTISNDNNPVISDDEIVSQAIIGLLDDSPVEMIDVSSWEEFQVLLHSSN